MFFLKYFVYSFEYNKTMVILLFSVIIGFGGFVLTRLNPSISHILYKFLIRVCIFTQVAALVIFGYTHRF